MLVFGPVPSRRLGRSIGINNIPPKACTYSCVYCQVGNTSHMSYSRKSFYDPDIILKDAIEKLRQANILNTRIDYITVVADGEPTLDINLGILLEKLGNLGPKIAVISNSSLIWDADVRRDLQTANWISLKIDTVNEETWHRIDRPHGRLSLNRILEGIQMFAAEFKGVFVTETMMVRGINDKPEEFHSIGKLLKLLKPDCAYISVPTRPPAESWVYAPSEDSTIMGYNILTEYIESAAYLIAYEGDEFTLTDELESDLLNILSVHPMRESAVMKFLSDAGQSESFLKELIRKCAVRKTEYNGSIFYVRRFSGNSVNPKAP